MRVHSAHGFWIAQHLPMWVGDADDESPQYRFRNKTGESYIPGHDESTIDLVYTVDAPQELVSHAFQLDLSCFWNLRGCASARHMAPLMWRDQQAIVDATVSRLHSQDPCPDRILAGRARYQPDLTVDLFEVTESKQEIGTGKSKAGGSLPSNFRFRETILGDSEKGQRWERVPPGFSPKPGDKVLAFWGGANYQSCAIVRATPTAESAVRTAVPAPRRIEDDISRGQGQP